MSDLISRQAAIDAVNTWIKLYVLNRTMANPMSIQEMISALPSVQPEPIKINIEDFNKEDWERLKKEWGNTPITVLPAQPEIVRCKECIYHAGWDYCEEVDGLWYDDDFCCHGEKGERRDDG